MGRSSSRFRNPTRKSSPVLFAFFPLPSQLECTRPWNSSKAGDLVATDPSALLRREAGWRIPAFVVIQYGDNIPDVSLGGGGCHARYCFLVIKSWHT